MQLACKNCGALIPANDINIQTMLAVCKSCDAVFRFQPDDLTPAKAKRMESDLPAGIQVEDYEDGFLAHVNWRKAYGNLGAVISVIMAVAGVIVGVVMLFVVINLLRSGHFPLIASGMALVMLSIWLVFALFAMASLISDLKLDREWLTFKHHPAYWWGKRIRRSDIASVQLKPYRGSSEIQTLVIVTRSDRQYKIDSFPALQARYLQRHLNHVLFASENAPFPDDLTAENVDQLRLSDDGEWVIDDDRSAGGIRSRNST